MAVAIGIVADESFPTDLLDSVAKELNAAGIESSTTLIPNQGPFAALEWLIPTALGVFILKPYFEGFLNKAGEDHYEVLKNVVVKNIWPRIFGPKRNLERRIVSVGAHIKENIFSSTFSIRYSLRVDSFAFDLCLLFPKDISMEETEDAIHAFLKLIEGHERDGSLKQFAQHLYDLDNKRAWTKVLWYNSALSKIELLDPIASSREGRLVSKKLPE